MLKALVLQNNNLFSASLNEVNELPPFFSKIIQILTFRSLP